VKENPTYRSLGDHSEAIRIVFNPALVSYETLLEVFWGSHNPCRTSASVQYRSAVFFEGEAQERQALLSRTQEEEKRKEKVITAISPLGTFYPAEEYHQKYYLRSHGPLMSELSRLYPDFSELRETTLAARVNGYLGGNLSLEDLADALDALGIKRKDTDAILSAAARRR
jgi:hypothetical protein